MFFTKKSKFEKRYPVIYAVIIGSAIVLFWRGLWGILDLYLLPGNPLLSYIVSLILGITILGLTHHITKSLNS